MNLRQRIKSIIFDPSRELRERVFIMLTFIVLSTVTLALIGDIIYGENIVEIIVLAVMLVFATATTIFGIKRRKVDLYAKIIAFGVVFIIIPVIFFFGGGMEGGAVPWMVFTYLYIGLLLEGWWRTGMITILTIVVAVLYHVGYVRPDLIVIRSREIEYWDQVLAVIEVGFVCFAMTWFQNLLYMEENRKAREETKKVEELNNSQNRFFSSMSHEIRTPINSILGLNEIILRQKDASDEIRRDAANIQGAGRMLLAIINDILDFSKIEAGKMDIVPVNYKIAELVSEIVNMIWLRAQQKGLEFKIEIDPSIPAELFGDEVRIKQILINLLNNAVKYTNEGSVTLHIEKENQHEDQVALTFSVTDTGMGIKQDALPHLFDAFRRVDEEKNTKIEGTGLGLSIVKQLVDLMGGRVTVNSVYTQGSTFIVSLWQKVTRYDAVGDINLTNYEKNNQSSFYSPGFVAPDVRILIVDDNEMNLEVEKKLLDGTQITVDTATSGSDALLLTTVNQYDIILMDHLMPEMDGIECMQNVKKQQEGLNNKTPIIVLTANAGADNKELYSRSGFEDYLVKPVSGRQLEDMILSHVPEFKVQLTGDSDISRMSMNTTRGYSRKIPVEIVTGSICDLPKHVIKKYQIHCIPFIVRSGGKTYYDGVEAESDELFRYMRNGTVFESDAPSVEEFEKFFAGELKNALNIIYIASAGSISFEYKRALEAAKAYGNVEIFDSGVGSSASGMLVLIATWMALRGDSHERILDELKKARSSIHCSFVTDGSFYMRKKDSYSMRIADLMKTFSVRPVVRCKESRYHVSRIGMGDLDNTYLKYVDHVLSQYSKPDPDVIFIIYSEFTEQQKEMIASRINKRYTFDHIIYQKASAALSLNLGEGAIGLAFFEKSHISYNISTMLVEEDEIEDTAEEAGDTADDSESSAPFVVNEIIEKKAPEEVSETIPEREPKWYDDIEGIDADAAIKNSGSEETFKSVLKIFYDSADEKIDDIKKAFDAKDWENYTIRTHAMKSSAKLVGALKLSDDALALEMAGKEGDMAFIEKNHAAFVSALKSFRLSLESVFEGSTPEIAQAEPDEEEIVLEAAGRSKESTEKMEAFLITSIFEAIKAGAQGRDDAMIKETIEEAMDCGLPSDVEEEIKAISKLFENRDYDGILAAIESREGQ